MGASLEQEHERHIKHEPGATADAAPSDLSDLNAWTLRAVWG